MNRRTPNARIMVCMVASAAIVLATSACGSLTAGGATGEAHVVISGDAQPVSLGTAGLGTPALPALRTAAVSHLDDSPEGQLEATFTLALIRDDGTTVPLSDDDIDVSVDLEGVEEPEVANRTLDSGRYTGFRIVFTELEVEVDAGLVINGDTVTGPIDIEFDDVELPVERSLVFDVPAEGVVELVVDLNAATWLQAVDPTSATVSASTVAAAIDIVVR